MSTPGIADGVWSRGSPVMRIAVVAATVLGGLLLAVNLLAIARDPSAWVDLKFFYGIIHDWWNGDAGLYPPTLKGQREPGFPSYRYPPLWATLMVPLVEGLPPGVGMALWSIVALAIFFGGLALLGREAGLRWSSPRTALFVCILAVFAPLFETFYGPTFELPMVGLMAAAFALSERGRCSLAGLAFAGAVILKVYPVFFGLYFLLVGRIRLLLYAAAWYLLLNLLSAPIIGFEDTFFFHFRILPFAGGSTAFLENASVEMLLMQLRWRSWFVHGVEPLSLEEVLGVVERERGLRFKLPSSE